MRKNVSKGKKTVSTQKSAVVEAKPVVSEEEIKVEESGAPIIEEESKQDESTTDELSMADYHAVADEKLGVKAKTKLTPKEVFINTLNGKLDRYIDEASKRWDNDQAKKCHLLMIDIIQFVAKNEYRPVLLNLLIVKMGVVKLLDYQYTCRSMFVFKELRDPMAIHMPKILYILSLIAKGETASVSQQALTELPQDVAFALMEHIK